MAHVPEQLDKQVARATRRAEERRLMPLILGAIVGGVTVLAILVIANILGIIVSRRVGAVVAGVVVGLVGPFAIDRLVARYPEHFGVRRADPD